MAMPLHRSLMALEEFVALPEDDSARCELQEGALVVAEPFEMRIDVDALVDRRPGA